MNRKARAILRRAYLAAVKAGNRQKAAYIRNYIREAKS